MRKFVALFLATVMCLSLTACGGGKDKKAFEVSKEAYDLVNSAYEITESYGSDIYEAWRLGIYEDDEVIDGGCSYLAGELSLSEDEIAIGVAYALGEEWENISEDEIDNYIAAADLTFSIMEDNLFSWCVAVVSDAYVANGKVDEAQGYIDEAKSLMKELSESYSDYEHYPSLKGYYTTTSSYFDFCQNPTGSFEQLKTTIENYRTEARDYKAELDYIFED